jgi:penicillin V acylase-like amidase (Ntn superfamily)
MAITAWAAYSLAGIESKYALQIDNDVVVKDAPPHSETCGFAKMTISALLQLTDSSCPDRADQRRLGMRSSTLWTSASDTNNKVFYYHMQHNRRVRMVDLKKIDFGSLSDIKRLPLDKVKGQDIQDATPQ